MTWTRLVMVAALCLGSSAGAQIVKPAPTVASVTFPGEKPLELSGRLFRPAGEGPFPAVVLLHGCGGVMLTSTAMDRAANPLLDSGYVVLIVDSFGPRHVDSVCGDPMLVCVNGQPLGTRSPTARERADDAFAAQRFLSSLPFVDSSRIGLLGWSHGGIAALRTWERNVATTGTPPFAAIAAYYPCCAVEGAGGDQDAASARVPLAIFIGTNDDWCPVTFCQSLAVREAALGRDLSLAVYPGATHNFDGLGKGTIYLGHKMEPDPGATQDSHERLITFFGRTMKRL